MCVCACVCALHTYLAQVCVLPNNLCAYRNVTMSSTGLKIVGPKSISDKDITKGIKPPKLYSLRLLFTLGTTQRATQ